MYRSGLVPRRMALFGLVGGPLVCASGIAVMFGFGRLRECRDTGLGAGPAVAAP
jgi:hypothetical protein